MLRPTISLFFVLSLFTGIIYPLLTTGIGKIFFAEQTAGSLIIKNEKIIGSKLIGQNFTKPHYFWGRPSATFSNAYNALASGGSNLGPLNPGLSTLISQTVLTKYAPYNALSSGGSELAVLNPLLTQEVKNRISILQNADAQKIKIPVDLVTASASGLDPHISPAAAYYQAHRVAKARNLTLETVNNLIQTHIEQRHLFFLGEPRVNVLQLNLALDHL